MKFKAFVATVLSVLGLKEWTKNAAGADTVTDEQKAQLRAYGFADVFIEGFAKALEAGFVEQAEATPQEADATLRATVAHLTTQLMQAQADLDSARKAEGTSAAALKAKQEECDALTAKVKALAEQPELEPAPVAAAAPAVADNLDDARQLFGLQGAMYALEGRPYNERARAALIAARTGMSVMASSSTDYSRLKEDLGAFYLIPWQQRIQSLLQQLPSMTSVFALETGYQDMAALVNVWLGEFSQAGNEESDFDQVTKGAYDFGSEILRMSDVMFAHKFTNLKEIEKTWIGSLNKEGSQAIKWSFIEFLLAETAKKLHNEQQLRRVNGVRKDPDLNQPGRAMEAADGVYEYIRKKVDGHVDLAPGNTNGRVVYQIKPFELGDINAGNIGEKIYEGTQMIPAVLRDSGQLRLYMPSHMVVLYHKYNEAKYGTNRDYKADINYVKEYPSVLIVEVPNADNHNRLIWTMDGNIKFYEHVPGEMIKFNIEQQDWTLKVWSEWKEGVAAMAVGYKYTDKADMDYDHQMIFCNETDMPATYFVEAQKDAQPDALLHTSIVTVPNSSTLAITDVQNAAVGVPVTIKCGSTAYGVTIAKADKFSLITAAWTPAKGDTITLVKRADGKFIEVARTTNATGLLQFEPNATTPSVADGIQFVVGTNTAATALTTLADATPGKAYTIHGYGTTNATTIANGGNFVLTAAITLSAGHSITLVKAADGKFYEVERT